MSVTSTYMGFPISTIAVDSGLNWETNLNAALSVIDQHNHSPGSGQQIQPSGLNINSDLSFNANNAVALRTARFTSQASAIPNTGADVGEIYVAGNELWYNDYSGGNQVQITLNGTVNATSSGISSGTATAAFSAGTLVVKSSGSSYGNVALKSVVLANSGNLVNQLTLQAPALSSSYSLTLPAVPGSTSFMTLDATGNMAGSIPVSGGITTTNISPTAGIVGTQLSASANILGTQLSATAGVTPAQNDSTNYFDAGGGGNAWSTTVNTPALIGISIAPANSTSTRPVFIVFQDVNGSGITIGTTGTAALATFVLKRRLGGSTTVIDTYVFAITAPGASNVSVVVPYSSFNTIDLFPQVGAHYEITAQVTGNGFLPLATASGSDFVMGVVQV